MEHVKAKKLMVSAMVPALSAFAAFAGASSPQLVPDYDRDGTIDEVDCKRAVASEAFTIWLNDDNDAEGKGDGAEPGDTNSDLHDIPGGEGISPTGLELIERKVKELRIMIGCFDSASAPVVTGGAEYNAAGDPSAAKEVLENWPSPIVVTPWEVGLKIDYKSEDVLDDFPVGTLNPTVRAAYERWREPPSGFMNLVRCGVSQAGGMDERHRVGAGGAADSGCGHRGTSDGRCEEREG